MNKSIASLAFLVAANSAFAIIGPPGHVGAPRPRAKTKCLHISQTAGGPRLADCDSVLENAARGVALLANGCAQNQAALVSYRVVVPMCSTFAQL